MQPLSLDGPGTHPWGSPSVRDPVVERRGLPAASDDVENLVAAMHPADRRVALGAAVQQQLPFAVAAVAVPAISLGIGEPVRPSMLAAGLVALTIATVGMVVAVMLRAPTWLRDVLVLCSLPGLALVVMGTGGEPHVSAAVLLVPVLWMALYGSGRTLLTALVLQAVTVSLLATTDRSSTARDELRFAAVLIAVSVVSASAVFRVVRNLSRSEARARRQEQVLRTVGAAIREIQEGPDARQSVCAAVLAVTDGNAAALMEPDGPEHLRVTASAGTQLPPTRIHLTDPSISAVAYQTGMPVYVPDTANEPRANPTMLALTHARSVLAQPFQRDGKIAGVAFVTWPDRHPSPPLLAEPAMALLAREVGLALERAELRTRLHEEATTDSLTGAANRRVWRSRVPDMMTSDGSLCVAMLDLDHFKSYNDTLGHLAGDDLLRDLVGAWSPLLRPTDLLVRWGGEEFAIALPDCDPDAAITVIDRLREAVPAGQTASAGIACWDGRETLAALVARADAALYEAKRAGRDVTALAAPPSALATDLAVGSIPSASE